MVGMKQLQALGAHNKLRDAGIIIKQHGLACGTNVRKSGAVDIAGALAVAMGATTSALSGSIDELRESVAPLYRGLFFEVVDYIEACVEEDIYTWNDQVGQDVVLATLSALAYDIEHA